MNICLFPVIISIGQTEYRSTLDGWSAGRKPYIRRGKVSFEMESLHAFSICRNTAYYGVKIGGNYEYREQQYSSRTGSNPG